jgi:2-iminobutanoate/2-iminopropanoate deaminase
MKTHYTKNAPEPIGPYSQAMEHNGLLYLSGQIAINPLTGDLNNENIESEIKQVMINISSILSSAGAGFDKVIKTTIFLTNMDDFAAVNAVYGRYFNGDFPARETVEVSRLPKNVRVEISMIAALN